MSIPRLKFPQRFELEGVDPYKLKVVVVDNLKSRVFSNLDEASKSIDFNRYCGPMADKHEGVRCVRFECVNTYAKHY